MLRLFMCVVDILTGAYESDQAVYLRWILYIYSIEF